MKKILLLLSFVFSYQLTQGQPIGSKNQLLEVQGRSQFDSSMKVKDGQNIQVGTTTGTMIGTSQFQKIGFYGTSPVSQQQGGVITGLINTGLFAPPPNGPIIADVDITFNDNTTGNVTTSKHGYFPKLDGNSAHAYFGDGTWGTTVAAGQGLSLSLPKTVLLPDVTTAGTYDRVTVTSYGIVTGGEIGYVQMNLTSSQLLSLNSTPVQLVASPGAGKVIMVTGIIWDLTFVSSPYSSTVMNLSEGGVAYKYLPTICLATAANIIFDVSPFTALTGSSSIPFNNSAMTEGALTLTAASNPTGGDGSAKITVFYKIVTR